MTAKVYNFYPNNFTETTGYYVNKKNARKPKEALTDRHRIIVLADDVVYHVSEAADPTLEPVVDIAICEAGYARIIGLSKNDTGFPKNLRRCVIEIVSFDPQTPCKFVLRELDGTLVNTMGRNVPVWVGRLLSHQKSQTAFIFAPDSTSTYDIEFFRVRPIVENISTPTDGSLESATYRDPARPKKKRAAPKDSTFPRAVRTAGGLKTPHMCRRPTRSRTSPANDHHRNCAIEPDTGAAAAAAAAASLSVSANRSILASMAPLSMSATSAAR